MVLINLSESAAGVDVGIDIRPGSDLNRIQPFGAQVIPVAILGSSYFDVLDLEVGTLAFGPDGAAPARDLSDPDVLAEHLDDVNGDGFIDLITHYRSRDTGIAPGDKTACLTGMTVRGAAFTACDSIRVMTGRRGERR